MLSKKEAYTILELNENASKDEIEKRYGILVRKYKAIKSSQNGAGVTEINFSDVTEAYNILMGNIVEETEAQGSRKESRLLKKVGIDEKKAGNFFYYYKFHIIFGIITLLTLVYLIKGCVARVEPDFNIALIGSFYYEDTDALKAKIIKEFPGIKEIGIDSVIIPDNPKSQSDYSMQMKAMVLMAAGDIDVYIMDKKNFEKYAPQGAFASLDELSDKLGIDKNRNKEFILKADEEQSSHLYGIDVSSSSVLKDENVSEGERIAAINVKAPHYDKAAKLLEILLK